MSRKTRLLSLLLALCVMLSVMPTAFAAETPAYAGSSYTTTAPLPEIVLDDLAASGISLNNVYDFSAYDGFRSQGGIYDKAVTDADSDFGKAFMFDPWGDGTFNSAYSVATYGAMHFRSGGDWGAGVIGSISKAALAANANNGYNWYKVEDMLIPEKGISPYLTGAWGWRFQFNGANALLDQLAGTKVDMFVRIKIEGDMDNTTDSTKSAKYYFDRFIFVAPCDILASGTCGGEGDGTNLTWELTKDGTLNISGTGAMADYSFEGSPWYDYGNSIKAATLDEEVTSIGDYSFYGCTNLTTVVMFDKVTKIGDGAFWECIGLNTVLMGGGVTTIGEFSFCGCTSLTSITIPYTTTAIGSNAFFNCSSLTIITTIPDGVTNIGSAVFSGCDKLENITVSSSNSVYSAVDGVLFSKDKTKLVCYPAGKSVTYAIPDSVTAIGDAAFYECDSLVSVTIPDSVTDIGFCAFEDCDSLTSVSFGNGVTQIGCAAFYNCDALTSVVIPKSVTVVVENAFHDCDTLASVYFVGNAPSVTEASSYYSTFPETAILYYIPGTTGWTDSAAYDAAAGTWNGYTLKVWEEKALTYPTSVEKTSMVLGNDLSFLFAFTADGITGTDNYATITKTYADGTADRVERMEQSAWSSVVIGGKKHYTISFDGVAAKEMTDEMQVQIFNADGEPISEVYTDSIRDYAMRMIENGTSVQMFVDMLVFGAEAQKHFGYSDSLATSKLTAEQLAQATQSVSYANTLVSDDGYRASSLMLENNIQLVLLFGGIDQSMTAEVSYADHYGYARNFTIAGSEFEKVIYKGETCYSITVDALVMADGRQLVTVTVKDADGNKVTSAADSVESYIARMSSSGTLYEAIMKFSDSAAASLKNWQ